LDNWDKVPKNTDTAFNQEGTTAHEVAASLLQDRKPNTKDSYACPVPITPEMNVHAWNYMEFVLGLKSSPQSKLVVEQKLPLWYMPGRNAIVDAAVINPDSLHIIDYKYGVGIIVSPERNKQAIIYARSIAAPLDLAEDFPIFIYIYQPRGRAAEDAPYHVWQTTWGEIAQMADDINFAAQNIQNSVGIKNIFAPSEKACQWCPAKGFCTERPRLLMQGLKPLNPVIDGKFEVLPPASSIEVSMIATVLKHGGQIKKWIGDIEERALELMKGGGKVPGFKLVKSRGGNRFWTDADKAGKMLLKKTHLRENEVYEKSVVSVASLEKLLGKNNIPVEVTNLIGRPDGQPTIAPEDDKRECISLSAENEFSKIISTNIEDF
jgi:hypothetical protein